MSVVQVVLREIAYWKSLRSKNKSCIRKSGSKWIGIEETVLLVFFLLIMVLIVLVPQVRLTLAVYTTNCVKTVK